MRKEPSKQLDLFAFSSDNYKITKPIRIISFFSGIGFQEMGIKKVFPNAANYKTCEWAIPSIIGYDAVWNGEQDKSLYSEDKKSLVDKLFNLGVSLDYNKPAERKQLERLDINKLNKISVAIDRCHNLVNIMSVKGSDLEIVDKDKYEYLMTYSFPCQDLSLAGLGKGMSESQAEGGTRSGLIWEIIRILNECGDNKPQLLLCENVPQLHSKDNLDDFYKLQLELNKMGYLNFWEDLNAKDYGIPQNRVRTFMLSIYDPSGVAIYSFPHSEKLVLRLKDLLEDSVDEKYYLSDLDIERISSGNAYEKPIDTALSRENREDGVMETLTTHAGKDSAGMKLILVKNANSKGCLEAGVGDGVDISSRMQYHRGTVQKDSCQTITTSGEGAGIGVVVLGGIGEKKSNGGTQYYEQNRIYDGGKLATSVTAQSSFHPYYSFGPLAIRKLIPLECIRLMGAADEVYYALRDIGGLSDSQIYHIAGDGLVPQVVSAIMEKMKNE